MPYTRILSALGSRMMLIGIIIMSMGLALDGLHYAALRRDGCGRCL